ATSLINMTANLPINADKPEDRAVYSTANPYGFDRLDPNSYNFSQQQTVYDSEGNAQSATFYFVRTGSVAGGDAADTWDVHMFIGNEEASATTGATPADPAHLTFDNTGTMTAPAGPVAFSSVFPSGAASPLAVTLDFGTATKQAAGAFNISAIDQDGIASAKLSDVSIGEDGLVTGSFTDGTTQALGKLLIANFANPSGLRQRGDGRWTITGNSGDAVVGEAG